MSGREPEFTHQPVLRDEVLEVLSSARGGVIVDSTIGLGGHSEALLESDAETRIVGFDQDSSALERASQRLKQFAGRVTLIHSNFEQIAERLAAESVDAVVADLGVSSMQLDDKDRGFSFRYDAPLDMRMDRSRGITAAEMLAEIDQEDLANLIYEYGEERHSRKIARRIIERRDRGEPVQTTKELAELVAKTIGRGGKDKIHPATRTFQAIRIAVNRELEIIDGFIEAAVKVLKKGGLLAVITFHSLEDRIVKNRFQRLAGKCICPPRIPVCVCGAEKKIDILTRKPIAPSSEEQSHNPRSRSAKLRVLRKI